jgi:L-threonylcarbamoyladenylate synthase
MSADVGPPRRLAAIPIETRHMDDERALADAVATLRAGGVVVVPTDTVYGLAALPSDPGAVRKIFLAKGRPANVHLPVMAASLEQVRRLGVAISRDGAALAGRWWPGPLTLALGFDADAPRPAWLEGRLEVAVRVPDHDFLRAVLMQTGVLLVTSANQHGSATPPGAEEAATTLAPHVSLIIDGGRLEVTPSTLVNVGGAVPVIEREGALSETDIAHVLEQSR